MFELLLLLAFHNLHMELFQDHQILMRVDLFFVRCVDKSVHEIPSDASMGRSCFALVEINI